MESIKVGFTSVENVNLEVKVHLKNQVHWLICGGSGSGKSVLALYVLNQLMSYATDIYIADFKNTKDYENITSHYAVGSECSNLFLEFYNEYEKIKAGTKRGRIWLIWDEMAGNLLWLESQDKKLAQNIKAKMGEVLMMGRSLAGGSAGVITILQRPDSSNYSSSGRENYHVKLLLGVSSVESRKMMGFLSDEIPKDFKAGVGKGLLITAEKPFPVGFTVPQICKERMIKLLQQKGSQKK